MIIRLLILLAATLGASAAHAEWREATTRNFVVYSDGDEASLRAFAEKLERFDFVLRTYHRVNAPPSPNKLRIVLVQNSPAVAAMAGMGGGIAGYYVPDARAMMMVGSRNRRTSAASIEGESVLLHEYTHHFMYQYFPATYPTWYSEGFAEFWGSTRFLENDVVEVGRPVEYRYSSLEDNRWMQVGELLTAQSYGDVRGEVDLLYAQGWLLVRYAWQTPERQRQLQSYLALINRGSSYQEAARQAFGDVGQLNDELRAYSRRNRFDVIQLPFRAINVGDIALRTLSPAEQALFTSEVRLGQGVSNQEFPAFAAEVRNTARRFPNEPFALRLLVEVERIANNLPAANEAADRLLAVAPNDPRGLMHKALLRLEANRAAGRSSEEEVTAAREMLQRAMRLAPGDPLVHEAYYNSWALGGQLPPEQAQAELYRALELAPSDPRLRYKVASDFEQRNMISEAIAIIRPDAYRAPRRDEESARQREQRERLEDRNRRAGTARRDTAREMLTRLLQKQQGRAPAAAAAQ
jgi:tetratricopeptide (TPR) repeat protein